MCGGEQQCAVVLGKKTRAEGGERPIIVRQLDRNRNDLRPTDTRSVPSVYKTHNPRNATTGLCTHREAVSNNGTRINRNRRRRRRRRRAAMSAMKFCREWYAPLAPSPPSSLSTETFFSAPPLADGR
jgi:hypothetical protein